MKKVFFLILSSWILYSCKTAQIERITDLQDGEMLLGVLVKDTHTGEILYEKNSRKAFVPASNTKILSLYASLLKLDERLIAFRYYWQNDTLFLKGTGDPTLLHPDFPDSPALDLMKKASVIVITDENQLQGRFGSGWMWDDYSGRYQAELSSVPIYGNMIWAGSDNGRLNLMPSYFERGLIDSALGIPGILRQEFDNTLLYDSQSQRPDNFGQLIPFKTSLELTASLLSDTLGISVLTAQNINSENLLEAYSQPLDTVLRKMMQESDNLLAEQLLIMAGEKETGLVSTSESIKQFDSWFFPPEAGSYRWVDGSGLSRYNLFSPHQMVDILERIYREIPQDRLFSLLSVGGQAGTLRNKYLPEPDGGVHPYVFSKTGSMAGVYNESGFLIAKSGRLLTYSVMRNNFTGTVSENGLETMNLVKEFREKF